VVDSLAGVRPRVPDHNPGLLAFIKCHVTSLAKWHALRALADHLDEWVDASLLERQSGSPAGTMPKALAELAAEGVIEETAGPVYRLRADDPTARVLDRLLTTVARNREIRQIMIAHMRSGSPA
jgi:hypothetical protein